LRPDNSFEKRALGEGYRLVAGVDEAGRGCLFGPVFAAAVILDKRRPVRGLQDSKQLSADRREELAAVIKDRAVAWAVAEASNSEIDRMNIYQASRLAMLRAVKALAPSPDYLLLDAMRLELGIAQESLIRGDARCRSIAAASILAKTARDASMGEWDRIYPDYGLAGHKGYCTRIHLEALARLGPTPHHRFSFAPVRESGSAGVIFTPPLQGSLFPEAQTAAGGAA
jgi:ribonuclease HII